MIEEGFITAIRENPAAEVHRLVYADWLEERGDPCAEFLRVECEILKLPPSNERLPALRKRLHELYRTLDPVWMALVRAVSPDSLGELGEQVEDAYTVWLVDWQGHVLERDGTWYLLDSGHPHFQVQFADLASAQGFGEEVVRELPHVECEIRHGGRRVLRHFDAQGQQRELNENARRYAARRRKDRLELAVLVGLALLAIGGLAAWLW